MIALLLGSLLVLAWLHWEWKQIRRQQRLCWDVREVRRVNAEYLARRVATTIPKPRPQVEVSEYGVFVGSSDVHLVAEVVSHDPAFYARTAA